MARPDQIVPPSTHPTSQAESTKMMLIERLRTFGAYVMDDDGNMTDFQPNQLTTDAADMIEWLRAAGDALVSVLRSGSDTGCDAAIDAWEEARRG